MNVDIVLFGAGLLQRLTPHIWPALYPDHGRCQDLSKQTLLVGAGVDVEVWLGT